MTLVNFWQMIDNGGRGIQFTVEDMCGTNIERTLFGIYNDLKTYSRRKKAYELRKQNGELKPNEKAPKLLSLNTFPMTLQEGVREFLTGPIMTFAPFTILAGLKKTMGNSINIHGENLFNLTNLMKSVPKEAVENGQINHAFFKKVVEDMLNNTLNGQNDVKASKEQIDSLTDSLNAYYQLFIQKKPDKKALSQTVNSLQETFASILKNNKAEYKTSTFLNAKYSLPFNSVGETKFKEYAEYACAYLQDFTKKINPAEYKKELADSFRNNKLAGRIVANVAMFMGTAVLMSKIPELYTKLSGKINPGGIDIYEQASDMNKNHSTKEVK